MARTLLTVFLIGLSALGGFYLPRLLKWEAQIACAGMFQRQQLGQLPAAMSSR